MQCPCCGEEMISGTIGANSGPPLSWTPEIAKSKFKRALGFESDTFGAYGYGEKVKAHRCEKCSKIIIDLLDDFNKVWK